MAIVWDKINASANTTVNEVMPYLTSCWDWAAVESDKQYNGKIFYINAAKTIGLHLYVRTGTSDIKVGVSFNGTDYHMSTENSPYSFKIEKTDTALIFSYILGSSISANNCEKIIIHNAINPKTNITQQVISYIGNKSTSNVSAIYASDVLTPADISKQNGGENVNSAQSVFIPLCNKATDFIATDVYECLCTSLSGWSFGDAMIDGHKYRMSGSIYALDE